MKLDKHVIDMFTELTKPSDDVKMEKTCYGTISVVDGTRYVKLDGSDLLVPAASTVKTSHGDRVTVLMKNHSLTVTGNLTAPATDGGGSSSGEAGTAATIEIGTVTTGEAGSSASVTNVGTKSEAVFDFVIPKGDKGDKGDTGPQGPQGEKGEKGDTGTWDGTIPDHEHTVSDITDFPTSLPANGGDADTLDGKHRYDFVNYLGSITDIDNVLNNPEYSDCPYEGVISSDVATGIGLSSVSIVDEWGIKCFRATDGSGFQIAVPIYRNSGESPKYRIANKYKLNGSDYVVEWGDWNNFSDNGNADTVDGKHANDFMQNLGLLTTGSLLDYVLTMTVSGSLFITGNVTDTPISGLYYGVDVIRHSGGDYVITATRFNGGGVWTNRYNAGMAKWYGWANVADGGNADTLDGLHVNEIASNPNLLDNPNFKINQRGLSVYSQTTKGTKMSVDRWAIYKRSSTKTGNVTLTPNSSGGLVLNNQTDELAALYQRIENFSDLFGKQITYSASINGSVLSLTTTCTNATAQSGNIVFTDDKSAYLRIWVVLDTYVQFEIYLNAGASITVDWTKVEMGGVATPFVPPDPATELAKCQRYALKIVNGVQAVAYRILTNSISFYFPTTVTFRVNVTSTADFAVQTGNSTEHSGFAFEFYTKPNGVIVEAKKTTHGITLSDSPILVCKTQGIFDAEL